VLLPPTVPGTEGVGYPAGGLVPPTGYVTELYNSDDVLTVTNGRSFPIEDTIALYSFVIF
jgi:hypothetical protein